MTTIAVPQLDPEQAARIRAAWEQLGRQLAEQFKPLHEAFRQLGIAVRRALVALAPLVRLADQRRARLRAMHTEYRRRLRHRRRRAR